MIWPSGWSDLVNEEIGALIRMRASIEGQNPNAPGYWFAAFQDVLADRDALAIVTQRAFAKTLQGKEPDQRELFEPDEVKASPTPRRKKGPYDA